MSNLWLKIKIWTKITLFALLLILGLIFVVKNWGEPVRVWLFGDHQTTLLLAIFYTCLASVCGTLLVRTTLTTLRQIRNLRQRAETERRQRELADMKATVERLQSKPAPAAETPPAPPQG